MCKKLIKWTLVAGVIAAGAGFLMFGSNVASYASTAFGDVRKAVVGSVPIDFELRRAKNLITKIDPEIQDARRDVARAEVELEALDGQIGNLKGAIAKAEVKMKRHRGYLSGEGSAVTVFDGNHDYGMTAVKSELIRTFDMYRNQVELLNSKESLRERQAQVLEAARNKLVAVRSERNKLVDTVETLEARKRQLDAMAATTQRYDLDTSNLREAKELLGEIKKRLDVSQKIIQEELFLTNGTTQAPTDQDRDILGEMEAYFGQPSEPAHTGLTPAEPFSRK